LERLIFFLIAGTPEQQREKLRLLVWGLPPAHRLALQYLTQLLTMVAAQQAVNMMTELNLATCLGPTILRPGREESFADATKMEIANVVTEKIIKNYDYLFSVSNFSF
jgi:hypothetical protein